MTLRQQIIGQYVAQLVADGVIQKNTPAQQKLVAVFRAVGQDVAVVLGVAGSTLGQSLLASLTQRILTSSAAK